MGCCISFADSQFFLACIARRTAIVSKTQMPQTISQFDTQQDLLGKILVVNTGYASPYVVANILK